MASLVFISKTRDTGPIVYDTVSKAVVCSSEVSLVNPYRTATSSDGEMFVATDSTNTTHVFIGSNLGQTFKLDGPAAAVAFSHDDRVLAIGGLKSLRLLKRKKV